MANNVQFNIKLKVDGKEQVVQIATSVEQLREVVNKSKSAWDNFQETIARANFAFQGLQSAVSGIATSLNDLTAESRSFGGAMAAANTMAGKSGEDFAALKDQVAELSKTVPIARDELANGLYQVISNGVPEDNWIEYLQKSAKASVGGIADLGETVKVTSTIIKNYGLQWSDAGSIQDKIQLTAKNGVTSFEQLAQALPRVTSQASTLGVSIDELMATFSTLTGVSGDTAEVSTQLAAIFTALIKPSSEAAEMAQQMGIQFDAAAIKAAGGMQNFLASLDQSVQAYSKASGMLEQEVYGKLFGSAESLRAITPLVGNLSEKFGENVAEMKKSAGTIESAFDTMASTGAAKLQMLNNKLGDVSDVIQSTVGNALPYLNFASQLTITASSAIQLSTALKAMGVTINTTAKAATLWNATSVRMNALASACSATMRGAAVSVSTLRLAIQGLLIATGVGLAIAALTGILAQFASSNDSAADSASRMASAEQQAANSIKSTYDNTLQQTYSSLMAKYTQMKDSYNALKSTHEKTEWLKSNKGAFDELRIKVDNISEAENVFKKNTSAVAQAFERRAKAAAYAAQLVELYKQQLDLSNRKKNVDEAISKATNQYNHSTNSSNQDNPYAAENAKRGANLAGIAADMKSGGDGNITKLNEQLDTTNKKIAETREALKGLGEDKIIDGGSIGKTSTSATGKGGTPKVNRGTNGSANDTPDPVKGSLDWYEKAISEKEKELRATANEETAKVLNAQMEGLQREMGMLKVRLGIESIPKVEVKKQTKGLFEQIDDEMKEFLQKFGDKPITISADIDIKEKDLENLKSLLNIDPSNFENVRNALESIKNITDPTAKGFAVAGASCQMLGDSLQKLGADSAAAKAGMLMAAIGQLVLSFAQAMQSASSNWITWLAFGIAGTAQLVSIISTLSGFNSGGIVGGNQTSGDNVLVRVNSGEMILNAAQQARLFALANGAAVYGQASQVGSSFARGMALPAVAIDSARLQAIGSTSEGAKLDVSWKLRGRDLVAAVANETRSNRRRSNIRI